MSVRKRPFGSSQTHFPKQPRKIHTYTRRSHFGLLQNKGLDSQVKKYLLYTREKELLRQARGRRPLQANWRGKSLGSHYSTAKTTPRGKASLGTGAEPAFLCKKLHPYEFLGRHIWPLHPDEADCPDLEALSRRPDPFAEPGIETDIFITSKRKFLMIVVDQAEPFDRFSHRTFDTLPELLEAFGVDAESNLAVYLAYAAGSPVTVKLDV